MIVWGGLNGEALNSGARYNPTLDTWTAMDSVDPDVPTPRTNHSAIWTGEDMIVWGGEYPLGGGPYASRGDGGRYNPSLDTGAGSEPWQPLASMGQPTARHDHTAVWTGTLMVIWGGFGCSDTGCTTPEALLNTGARYDLAHDTWTSTSTDTTCPSARQLQSAVWTGERMIVWGGLGPARGRRRLQEHGGDLRPWLRYLDRNGNRREPALRALGAHRPLDGERDGGLGGPRRRDELQHRRTIQPQDGRLDDDGHHRGRSVCEVSPRGGVDRGADGRLGRIPLQHGRRHLQPVDEQLGCRIHFGSTRRPTRGRVGLDRNRDDHLGRDLRERGLWHRGAVQPDDQRMDADASPSPPVPTRRYGHTAVWTGSKMIFWGGTGCSDSTCASDFNLLRTGALYDPATDVWTATSEGTNCPSARNLHTALWTGSEMIVWGGYDLVSGAPVNTGARFNPTSNSWIGATPISPADPSCPSARQRHTATWSGTQMVIWGGEYDPATFFADGGRYTPGGSWGAVSATSLLGRCRHTAVSTGTGLIVWGGYACVDNGDGCTETHFDDGAIYDFASNGWTLLPALNAPVGRSGHSGVWTGSEMLIWGGGR